MKKRTATGILQKQLLKIPDLSDDNTHLWYNQTCTYIIRFFSKDSYEFKYIKSFDFNDISDDSNISESDSIKDLKLYLNNCIETINNIGLNKPPVDNWFSMLPDWLMSLILVALFGLGIIIGNITNDKQNFNLRQDNKELKLLLSSSDSIANHYKKLSGNQK